MASFVQQTINHLALLVEHRWSLPQFATTDRSYLETFPALVPTVDELHECINYSSHWRQQLLLLQAVVEAARADTRPRHVRTDGIKSDPFFRQVASI